MMAKDRPVVELNEDSTLNEIMGINFDRIKGIKRKAKEHALQNKLWIDDRSAHATADPMTSPSSSKSSSPREKITSVKKNKYNRKIPDDVWEAEKILNERFASGRSEYRVKWKNFASIHNTWEPEENILDKSLISDYRQMTSARYERLQTKLAKKAKCAHED